MCALIVCEVEELNWQDGGLCITPRHNNTIGWESMYYLKVTHECRAYNMWSMRPAIEHSQHNNNNNNNNSNNNNNNNSNSNSNTTGRYSITIYYRIKSHLRI